MASLFKSQSPVSGRRSDSAAILADKDAAPHKGRAWFPLQVMVDAIASAGGCRIRCLDCIARNYLERADPGSERLAFTADRPVARAAIYKGLKVEIMDDGLSEAVLYV